MSNVPSRGPRVKISGRPMAAASVGPMVPVLPDKFVRGLPRTGAPRVDLVDLTTALVSDCETDAHLAAYHPPVPHRINKPALAAGVAVEMVALFHDVDAHDKDDIGGWFETERPKVDALLGLTGGFCYRTRGGYRLVHLLGEPWRIESAAEGDRWGRAYLGTVDRLADAWGIEADRACKDWTRLYRLPHATRDRAAGPERLEVIGDPAAIGVWPWPMVAPDVAAKTRRPPVSVESWCGAPLAGSSSDPSMAWAAVVLDQEAAAVARAPRGARSETLNRSAFALGQVVGAGLLQRSGAEAALQSAVGSWGEDPTPRKTAGTIQSGLDAGIEQPRGPDASAFDAAVLEGGQIWEAIRASFERGIILDPARPVLALPGDPRQARDLARRVNVDNLERVILDGSRRAVAAAVEVLAGVVGLAVEGDDDGRARLRDALIAAAALWRGEGATDEDARDRVARGAGLSAVDRSTALAWGRWALNEPRRGDGLTAVFRPAPAVEWVDVHDLRERLWPEFRGFVLDELPDGRRVLVDRSPTGAGKTWRAKEACREAAEAGRRVVYSAHRHETLDEIQAYLDEHGIRVRRVEPIDRGCAWYERGPEWSPAAGRDVAARYPTAKARRDAAAAWCKAHGQATDNMVDRFGSVCARGVDECGACPLAVAGRAEAGLHCRHYRQLREAAPFPGGVLLVSHAMLSSTSHFDAIKQANVVILDEDALGALLAVQDIPRGAFAKVAQWLGRALPPDDHEHAREILVARHYLGGLASGLARGEDPPLEWFGERRLSVEESALRVGAEALTAMVKDAASAGPSLAPPSLIGPLVRIALRGGGVYCHGRQSGDDGSPPVYFRGRDHWTGSARLVLLDATADPADIELAIGRPDDDGGRCLPMRVIGDGVGIKVDGAELLWHPRPMGGRARTYHRGRFYCKDDDGKRVVDAAKVADAADHIAAAVGSTAGRRVALVSYEFVLAGLRRELVGRGYDVVAGGHFGALTSSNEIHEAEPSDLVIIGTPRPGPDALRREALVLGLDPDQLDLSSRVVKEQYRGETVTYRRPVGEMESRLYRRVVERELIQAAGRARAGLRPVRVHLLTAHPFDLPGLEVADSAKGSAKRILDALSTGDEMTTGDVAGRLGLSADRAGRVLRDLAAWGQVERAGRRWRVAERVEPVEPVDAVEPAESGDEREARYAVAALFDVLAPERQGVAWRKGRRPGVYVVKAGRAEAAWRGAGLEPESCRGALARTGGLRVARGGKTARRAKWGGRDGHFVRVFDLYLGSAAEHRGSPDSTPSTGFVGVANKVPLRQHQRTANSASNRGIPGVRANSGLVDEGMDMRRPDDPDRGTVRPSDGHRARRALMDRWGGADDDQTARVARIRTLDRWRAEADERRAQDAAGRDPLDRVYRAVASGIDTVPAVAAAVGLPAAQVRRICHRLSVDAPGPVDLSAFGFDPPEPMPGRLHLSRVRGRLKLSPAGLMGRGVACVA